MHVYDRENEERKKKSEREKLTMQDILACMRIIFTIIISSHQCIHLHNRAYMVVKHTNNYAQGVTVITIILTNSLSLSLIGI